ncbi:hypothetical protein [Bradyrhizobium jicamae]|nr:hypothetical protein [Bradyrhizobium jicamae]
MTSKMDRRTFLQGTSAGALSTLFPFAAEAAPIALAAPKRGAATTLPSASGFNKGRSQVNLNFLQIGGDYPFLNCMKNAQRWEYLDNSGPPEPSELDSDGYPLKISHSGVYTVFYVPPQTARPGNYVVTWSGNGTIFCGMQNTPVSGSKTSTNGSGRYVFSTTDDRFSIGILSIGAPRITNMQVFHVSDEAALNEGQVFGLKFKQRLAEANFGVIRFLNWQAGNSTNVTSWATRKPISYVFYAGEEYRGSLYAGLTTKTGSAYSANLPGFTLADKATVIVRFNASHSGPCTLNVSGTGDINILDAFCLPLSAAGNSFPVGGTWQSIATLVYDATLKAWIKQGGDVALGSMGLGNGCPPELMVRLCAEVGAHPYFVTPALAIDPVTDYMPSLAAYCKANAPSWMIPRFEGPNELWNFVGGFLSTGFANAKATAYGWGADYHNWYGKVMSVLGQAISNVYGGDRTKYQVLAGVQTATGIATGETMASDARLASTKYLAQSAPPQALYSKTPASQWVTHVCCAQYYTPADYDTAQEQAYVDAYAAAEGNPTRQMEVATAYVSTVNNGSGRYTLPKFAIAYANWKAWALKFGIKNMCGYEGGYSPDYQARGTTKVDKLRGASKQAASLYNYTTVNYNNFVGLSDANFAAEFPSCFQLSGAAPSNNVWSVLEDIYQQTNSPQWNAIVAFNR